MVNNTLNIYEVLEALNKKINNNTTQIENNTEQLEDNNKQLKIQLDEIKVYLLENINKEVKSIQKLVSNKLEIYKRETDINLSNKQEILVAEEFKKLKENINNDLENLAHRVMNSRIL